MAADVDAIAGGVAVDAVRAESRRNVDRLDQLHGLDVEHRGLGMVAGEAVARLRAHGRAVAANTRNHAHRFSVSRSKIVSRFSKAGTAGLVSVAACACVAPRVMYSRRPAVSAIDVVRAALAADLRGLQDLVRPVGAGLKASPRT
jgi:hypothetical protein